MQATTAAEEERLGIDFAKLWEDRQKADVVALVERESKPAEGTKAISFDTDYSRGCVCLNQC